LAYNHESWHPESIPSLLPGVSGSRALARATRQNRQNRRFDPCDVAGLGADADLSVLSILSPARQSRPKPAPIPNPGDRSDQSDETVALLSCACCDRALSPIERPKPRIPV